MLLVLQELIVLPILLLWLLLTPMLGVVVLGVVLLLLLVHVVVGRGGGGGRGGRHGVGVVLRAALVDEPDAALLPDPVRNLPRVDPHSELVWQDGEKILLGKTTVIAC